MRVSVRDLRVEVSVKPNYERGKRRELGSPTKTPPLRRMLIILALDPVDNFKLDIDEILATFSSRKRRGVFLLRSPGIDARHGKSRTPTGARPVFN